MRWLASARAAYWCIQEWRLDDAEQVLAGALNGLLAGRSDDELPRVQAIDLADLLNLQCTLEYRLGLLNRQDQTIARLEEAARRVEESHRPAYLGFAPVHRVRRLMTLSRFEDVDRVAQAFLDSDPPVERQKEMVRIARAVAWMKLLLRSPSADCGARDELVRLLKPWDDPATPVSTDELDLRLALARLDRHRGRLDQVEGALRRARERLGAADKPMVSAWARLAAQEADLAVATRAPRHVLSARRVTLREAYRAFLDAWDRAPVRDGGISFLHLEIRRMVLGELVALCVALGDVGEGFDHLLAAQAKGTIARRLGRGAPSLTEIRRDLLRDGDGVLLYLPADGESHLFVVDREALLHYPLRGEEELIADLTASATLLAEPPTEGAETIGWREGLDRLSAALLPESARDRIRGWRHVYISGRGLLGRVPFEALPFDGEPLGWQKALSDLPSLPVALWLRERGTTADAGSYDLTVLASPETRRGDRLPFTAEHQRRIESLYAPGRTRFRVGEAATSAGLADALTDGARILQLLVHGAEQAGAVRPGCLVLWDDEAGVDCLVTCDDVDEGEPVPGQVILTACGSAVGHARLGDDGLEHVGGAFLMRGAHTVLVTDGEVNYDATFALNEVYHRGLVAGATPAEALRDARRAVGAETGHGWNHPYYFAGVRLVGLGRDPLPIAPPPSPWPRRVVLVLAVLAVAVLVSRRRGRDR